MMGFDPCNRILKNSHNGSSLKSVRVHSLTLLALPGTCQVTLGLPSWPATLQPPCFSREPEARVVTSVVTHQCKVSRFKVKSLKVKLDFLL
jgi:hypothetical protein